MKSCTVCNKEKEHNEFAKNGKYFKSSCKECDVKRVMLGYKATRDYVQSLKTSCLVCGYSRCKSALEFHHLDDSTKLFGVSGLASKRMWSKNTKKLIDDEVEKCVILCANCHREFHEGLISLD